MKITKYSKLGLLMVFTITVFIWGMSYLKGHDFFKRTNYYHTIYDRVDGLNESSAVTLNGYKVGQVRKISFSNDGTGRLIVTYMVSASFKIPKASVAQIVSSDIMGTKSIKLVFNPNKEVYISNDTIPGAIESGLKEQVSLQVLPIKTKAEQLLATVDSAITILTVIFNEDARDNLTQSFENINKTVSNIEKASEDLQLIVSSEKGNIQNVIGNINEISESLKNNTGKFDNVMKNLSNLTDSLSTISFTPIAESIANVVTEIEKIVETLNSDKGTAGKLINDPTLYTNLEELTNNLDKLLKDIRMNPKRYVHFAALDLGKEIYLSPSPNKNSGNIIFKVNLLSSPNKISTESEIFEGLGQIEENITAGVYNYLIGAEKKYEDIDLIFENTKEKFPDARIISFKNGKAIRLERALKLMEK